MPRGAVLLGVVACLALWPQAAAQLYDLFDPDMGRMVCYGQKLMDACAVAFNYIDEKWPTYSIQDFEVMEEYHKMFINMVECLGTFLDDRHWGDADVRSMALFTQKLMKMCAATNHISNPWSTFRIEDFEDESLYRAMLSELIGCLNIFL